ncbi:hypothetical protein A0H81_10479 [Grifola frondosa]|uniref:Uncharacterized protein n=1 Tax=Grifola frondosa TaxID=5627 RepID=A0A1C7M4F5_GRIFR|nr:hypothetical protein A0H81_10479 [Grifola frondosa]
MHSKHLKSPVHISSIAEKFTDAIYRISRHFESEERFRVCDVKIAINSFLTNSGGHKPVGQLPLLSICERRPIVLTRSMFSITNDLKLGLGLTDDLCNWRRKVLNPRPPR